MNSSTDIQAVVFDMDGVLINSHPAHKSAWYEFLRSSGKEVSDDEISFILDGRTRVDILRHFLGDLSDEELQRYGKRKDEIFRSMEHRIEPIPGVLEFLRELNKGGVACAIATSASEIRTLSTVERLGLSEYFEAVVTASDVAAGKPDPQVYELACERLSTSPQNAIGFDDAPAGVRSARSAGMRCIGVSNNGFDKLLAAGAETVIRTFTGLTLDSLSQGDAPPGLYGAIKPIV